MIFGDFLSKKPVGFLKSDRFLDKIMDEPYFYSRKT